jgi:hypothetical protein
MMTMRESMSVAARKIFPGPLRWILLIGAVHAFLYVFLVPPWQHYDEPGQFEFAWLIAHRNSLPQTGDYDPVVDQAIAASMQAHHFGAYTVSGYPIVGANNPSGFGGTQVDWQSVYYSTVSLPLRFLGDASIDMQLYAARIVSACMFLLTLMAAYGWMGEWTAEGNRLRWLVPLGMALLPGFVDIMTSVNNDVGAALGVTTLLWVAVRMVRRGFSVRMAVAAILLTGYCVWVKVTGYIAIPVLFLAVILSIAREKNRRFGILGIMLAGLIAFVSLFGWGDTLHWVRSTNQNSNNRVENESAPWGKTAFYFALDDTQTIAELAQPLPYEEKPSDLNTSFTLGGWIWCSNAAVKVSFGLAYGQGEYIFSSVCTKKPTFVMYVVPPIPEARNFWVDLSAIKMSGSNVDVYYDGIVLVKGVWPEGPPPMFDDSFARSGIWGGKRFVNMVRNPSAEFAGPRMNSWVDRFHFWNAYPSTIVQAAVDLPGSWKYYFLTAKTIFQTFWAKFSWGQVALLGGAWPYYALAGLSAFGCLGAFLSVLRQSRRLFSSEGIVTAVAVVVVWGLVFLRGVSSLVNFLVIPVARYTYPVLLPVMLILIVGLRELMDRARIPENSGIILWTAAFVGFDVFALYSQWFYYSSFG